MSAIRRRRGLQVHIHGIGMVTDVIQGRFVIFSFVIFHVFKRLPWSQNTAESEVSADLHHSVDWDNLWIL